MRFRPSLLLEMWQMKKSVCNDTLTFRLFWKSEIFITKYCTSADHYDDDIEATKFSLVASLTKWT